jgi:hypothetical protein
MRTTLLFFGMKAVGRVSPLTCKLVDCLASAILPLLNAATSRDMGSDDASRGALPPKAGNNRYAVSHHS